MHRLRPTLYALTLTGLLLTLTVTVTTAQDDAPGIVQLLYPVDTAVTLNAPEFQWQEVPAADFYEVRILGALDDGRLLLGEERYAAQFEAICIEGICQVTSPAAITVPVNYWQVRAGVRDADSAPWADEAGLSPWSAEASFTLAEGAQSVFSTGVPRPDSIGPNGSTEKVEFDLDPNFRWTHQPGASGYTLALFYREGGTLYPLKVEEYELNNALRGRGIDCSIADSCIADPIVPLTKDVDYTWAVRTEFEETPGPWSELLRFEMIAAAAFRFEFAEYADLELTIASPPRRAPVPGDVIPLVIDIENIGPQSAQALEVAVTVPEGLAYFWDTSAAREYDPDDGIWEIEVLPQHDDDQLTLYVEAVTQGEYTISAEIIDYARPLLDMDGEAADGAGDDYGEIDIQVVRAPVSPNDYPFGFNPDLLTLPEDEEQPAP